MNKSESIAKLTAALIAFHAKAVKVTKDGKNPHFGNRYASLSNIIDEIQGPLTECGLAIVQLPKGDNELETILFHESGEYLSESYVMRPARNDPQGVGSAITYQRRYALGAILSLNIDEDDDGNQASRPATQTTQKLPPFPDDKFKSLVESIKKEPEKAGKWLATVRKTYTLSNEQESALIDWESNLK